MSRPSMLLLPRRATGFAAIGLTALSLIAVVGALEGAPPDDQNDQPREGHPADHLPDYIAQVCGFGERPEWSHDGQRILFVAKPMGEVYELDLKTRLIESKTRHFEHYGFTRANCLANGDILLAGPNRPFDETVAEARKQARNKCHLRVLRKRSEQAPIQLGTLAAEGPAVSRTRMKIAWTHRDHQDPRLSGIRRRWHICWQVRQAGHLPICAPMTIDVTRLGRWF